MSKKIDPNELSDEDKAAYYYQLFMIYVPPRLGRMDSCIYYIEKGLPYIQSDSARIAQLEDSGQLEEAEAYFRKQVELARLIGTDIGIRDALRSLMRVLIAQGKERESVPYFEEVITLQDTIHSHYNQEQVAKAETKLGLTLKEKELENQRLLIAQQEQQQQLYLMLIGLLIVLLMGGLWVFGRIRKDKTLIADQKEQVEQSLTEKEFLLKEIHHRVKNNLQIISSLLDKQTRNSADQLLKGKMQEGKDRIQSMALIHQNLYQSESLSSIDLKKYIHELAHNITATQQAGDQNIKIDIDAESLQLNIDQAIPLGLILNELLTNTFKHAFKDRKEGVIKIQLKEKAAKQFELIFSDNGKGMKADFLLGQSKTLGLNLVNGLVEQLDGNLAYQSTNQGTQFTIQFKHEE